MFRYLYVVLQALITNASYAQVGDCGTDEMHQILLTHSTTYQQRTADANKAWINEGYSANKLLINGDDTIYEIKLVFHIMHHGEPVGSTHNPADSQIANLVTYVNKAFSATWPSYPDVNHGGVAVPIQFALATKDPDNNISTGIERIDLTTLAGYNEPGFDHKYNTYLTGSEFKWNGNYCYNVWLIDTFYASVGPGKPQSGYAYYPWSAVAYGFDGAVIRATIAKAGYITLIHELGHAMGLYHTFETGGIGRCPNSGDCRYENDMLCDTDPIEAFPDCVTDINRCTQKPYDSTRHNFMSYSDCGQNRFTVQQRDKMVHDMKLYRKILCCDQASNQAAASVTGYFYPNPAIDVLHISLPSLGSSGIRIYNTAGQMLLEQSVSLSNATIDISALPRGIYFCKYQELDKPVVKKFIKE